MTISNKCKYLIVFLSLFQLTGISNGTPFRPSNDAEVLEKLPQRAADPVAREVASLRAEMIAAPSDPRKAAQLARRYFDLAAERGDPRYVGYAEAVLTHAPTPLSAELLLVRGLVRQYRHDFSAALLDFDSAYKADPDLAEALAWRAAIFLVQADYVSATATCRMLAANKRPQLAAACEGLLLAYTGKSNAAYSRLQQALAQAKEPTNQLWLLTRLGEVAAWQGRKDVAERHYREALTLGRDDAYLMAAWADFLLDANRNDEVVKHLANQESIDPLLLRLAIAQTRLKSPESDRSVRLLGERFAAARQRGDTTHRAEEARYHLQLRNDAIQALQLASENYLEQREPRDARILLETARAARQPAAAVLALEWLKQSGFEDTTLRALAAELEGQR